VPRELDKPSLLSSFASAVALSALFLLVYGGCLAITSFRHDVHTLYFPSELRIPLVPAMIVPYWTLDLFFVCSFFLCANHRELRTLTLRLTTAMLIAGICFLLLPLRTAYANPHVGGFFGALFDVLHGFDLPYNCAPSLHIAIALILWAVYVPKMPYGPVRTFVALWFVLIMASTVLTWQHHLIDVVSGAAMGIGCLWTVSPRRRHSAATPRIFSRRDEEHPGRREYALPRRGRRRIVTAVVLRQPGAWRRRVPRRHGRKARWGRS
jgi:membrane-associated phospholipid phosphatase